VEIEKRTPIRFTHIILYEHTTIDPLQVLFSQKNIYYQCHANRKRIESWQNPEFHMEAEHHVEQF